MDNTTKNFQLTASEFNWELSENKSVKAWGFNGTVPGPVIRAKKGDTLRIRVKNELSEPTIVHWHGIRLPSSMDGTDDVQKPIQPGEEFEYRFEVPDAGTFWYHSHQNETEQMERGLYGALIVEDDAEELLTDRDRVLMIDDMKLTGEHDFMTGGFFHRWKERHDGREGETSLVNGREDGVIRMNAGQTERWRLINASSARYFRLSMEGRTFRVIGTDGGLLEKPLEVKEFMIVPGERIEILAGPFKRGDSFAMESLPYNRMTFVKSRKRAYARVEVGRAEPSVARIPQKLRAIPALAPQQAGVTRKIQFSVAPSLKNIIDFKVNGRLHAGDASVHVGELQVWEVANTSLMDHPFHLHGFFFQVIEEDGKAPAYRAWKDTYNLKPRSRVKIAWIPDNRPGRWMYHCHIIEHHQAGMMAHFEVVDPNSKTESKPAAHQHGHHHHAMAH